MISLTGVDFIEVFNPNIVYRKPIDDKVFKEKLNK